MSETEMTYDDAVSALESAIAQDRGDEQATPPVESAVTPSVEESAEQPDEAPEAPSEDSPETFFNPDELDPALLPGWKQLQAAFTQKTQALAEQRRQLEAYGDLEQVAQAAELYSRLSDPDNWVQLHAELTEAMQEYGLSPAEAHQAATEELTRQAQAPGGAPGALDLDDPDLAPLVGELQELRAQQAQQRAWMEQLENQRLYEQQVAEAEAEQAQYIAHMQKQVSDLRQQNPHYTDADIETVIRLGSFFNDDLGQAQAAMEAYVADRMNRYFEKKQGAAAPSLQPQSGAGVQSKQDTTPQTLDQAETEAIEYLRQLQAAGELDL